MLAADVLWIESCLWGGFPSLALILFHITTSMYMVMPMCSSMKHSVFDLHCNSPGTTVHVGMYTVQSWVYWYIEWVHYSFELYHPHALPMMSGCCTWSVAIWVTDLGCQMYFCHPSKLQDLGLENIMALGLFGQSVTRECTWISCTLASYSHLQG